MFIDTHAVHTGNRGKPGARHCKQSGRCIHTIKFTDNPLGRQGCCGKVPTERRRSENALVQPATACRATLFIITMPGEPNILHNLWHTIGKTPLLITRPKSASLAPQATPAMYRWRTETNAATGAKTGAFRSLRIEAKQKSHRHSSNAVTAGQGAKFCSLCMYKPVASSWCKIPT